MNTYTGLQDCFSADNYTSASALLINELLSFDDSFCVIHNNNGSDLINVDDPIYNTNSLTILPDNHFLHNLASSDEHNDSSLSNGHEHNDSSLTHSHELSDSNELNITHKQNMSRSVEVSDVQFSSCDEKCTRPIDMKGLDFSPTQLPDLPGFRFHPTEQELVGFYLIHKVAGALPATFDLIPEVELYLHHPWELVADTDKGSAKEWFFFVPRGSKHLNGARPNRRTKCGFWKATGTDKVVKLNYASAPSQHNGLKKTLVYYKGRAQNGSRTPWIMNEYRLANNSATNQHRKEDIITLCKLYKKKMPCTGSDVACPQLK
ncbi:hypothetical protein L7F22_032973 [Adiantum nelumboides]|nr:hypothetical protein [Adiantum nelumboides]